MPIVYETAAPIAAAGAVGFAQEQAQQRQRSAQMAAAAGQGGGFRGGRDDGFDIQSAIQNRDMMQFRQQQQADSMAPSARDQFLASAEMTQATHRATLQQQLAQSELSQQENMRLQRMRNAVGEVSADPTLTDDEKSNLILQLKTGIDPLQQRLTKTKLAQETLQKQAMTDSYNQLAALRQAEAKANTQSFEEKTTYWVPPDTIANIVADLKENSPLGGMVPPEVMGKIAQEIAMKQGLGVHMMRKSNGDFEPIQASGGASGSRSSAGGKGASQEGRHESGLDVNKWLTARAHIEDMVDNAAAQTVTDANTGGKSPSRPELQSPEGRQKEVERRLRAAGIPANLDEFQSGVKKPEQKGYKSPYEKPPVTIPNPFNQWLDGGDPAAAAPAKPEPFNPLKPESLKPEQRRLVEKSNETAGRIETSGVLDPMQKREALKLHREAGAILAEYGSVEAMRANPGTMKHYLTILSHLDAILSRKPGEGAEEKPDPRGSLRQAWDFIANPETGANIVDLRKTGLFQGK